MKWFYLVLHMLSRLKYSTNVTPKVTSFFQKEMLIELILCPVLTTTNCSFVIKAGIKQESGVFLEINRSS